MKLRKVKAAMQSHMISHMEVISFDNNNLEKNGGGGVLLDYSNRECQVLDSFPCWRLENRS